MDPGGLAIAIVGLLEGLPGSLGALRGLRSRGGAETAPSAAAGAAYLAFQAAASEMLFHVKLIVDVGAAPPIKGALWTYPVVYRSHRAIVDAAATVVAYGQMVMLSNSEVNESGYRFSVTLAEVTSSLPIVRRRIRSTPQFEDGIHTAQVALRDFLLAARADLLVAGGVEALGQASEPQREGRPIEDT